MLDVILYCGLGNRMFHLASCYGLSVLLKRQMRVLGSTPNWEHDFKHYMFLFDNLEALGIPCNRRVDTEIHASIQMSLMIRDHPTIMSDHSQQILQFSEHHREEDLLLHGCFLNEGYFSAHRSIIMQMLRLPTVVEQKDKDLLNTVAIHVRLGDFKTSPNHFIDLSTYYDSAIALARGRYGDAMRLVIVCEEPHLVSHYYPRLLDDPTTRLMYETCEIETFRFMTRCSGVIIANSTFSWWAAWMNETPNKFVTIPKVWTRIEGAEGPVLMDSQHAIVVDT